MTRRGWAAVGLAWILGGCATAGTRVPAAAGAAAPVDPDAGSVAAAAWFEAHRDRPPMVRSFLYEMPKGGDIHNHLSGAIYAESYLAWAAADGFCIEEQKQDLVPGPCDGADRVPAAEALRSSSTYNDWVDRLSVRNVEFSGKTGKMQFFATFGEFGLVSDERVVDMVIEVRERAAEENVGYLELMFTVSGSPVRKLGKEIGWDGDYEGTRDRLLADPRFAELLAEGRRFIAGIREEVVARMGCGTERARPGCTIELRALQQTTRTKPLAQVFAQLVFAFEFVQLDPVFVGINLVAPEDDQVSLRDYSEQMKMIGFLHGLMPEVPVALHAGELTLGLVPPEDLSFHIREAVEVAGARRIGHGVDLPYEDDAPALLAEMRDRDVLVEICLTSNDVILGVEGEDHPLPDYLAAGVPVTLASDDPGVSRIDLTHEYVRAAETYGFGYLDLKRMARNSLSYSFLSGESLWRARSPLAPVSDCAGDSLGSESPSPGCAAFLAASEKARQQWRLEADFRSFESRW